LAVVKPEIRCIPAVLVSLSKDEQRTMQDHLYKAVEKAFKELELTRSDLGPLVPYQKALLAAQNKARKSFCPNTGKIDIEARKAGLIDGIPLIAAEDLDIDPAKFDVLFGRLMKLIPKHTDMPSATSRASTRGKDEAWHRALIREMLSAEGTLEQFAEDTGIDLDLFTLVAFQTLIPFLEAYADVLEEAVDEEKWLKGYCPVCGGEPLICKLDQEVGRRIMHCSRCRTEWRATRLECPFCGTDDQKQLRFFSDDQEPGYRVDVCDKCKAYLKTVDVRKLEKDVILPVENLATIHLDLVAKSEGFRRDTNRLFGLA